VRVIRYDQQGWVSLPVIVLLLVVASLSLAYQQRLQDAFQWRATLDDVNQSSILWQKFQQERVLSPAFHDAQISTCIGFCSLISSASLIHTMVWHSNNEEDITYLWRYYDNTQGVRFYRLCARQDQQQYRCWWWRDHTLISQGIVSATH